MKNIAFILCLLMSVCAFAQNNNPVTGSFKKQFVGKWYDVAAKNHPNSIEIKFKNESNSFVIIDHGTGEAPPHILRAIIKGNIFLG